MILFFSSSELEEVDKFNILMFTAKLISTTEKYMTQSLGDVAKLLDFPETYRIDYAGILNCIGVLFP